MCADTPGNNEADDEMVTLNVTVPKPLLDELDALSEELNYPNRSGFIHAVLRNTTEPILTPGAQEGLSQGYADVAAGRTASHEAMTERYGIEE